MVVNNVRRKDYGYPDCTVFVHYLYVGNAPTRHDQALGRAAYDQQQENFHRRNKELAEKYDCYYERSQLPSMDIDQNFYGDGSLKRDTNTGKTYAKGQYYVDSRGQRATAAMIVMQRGLKDE